MECSIDWALGDSPPQRRDLGEWCHCWSWWWHWQLHPIPAQRHLLPLLASFCLLITGQGWGNRFHLWCPLEPQCGFLRLRSSFLHLCSNSSACLIKYTNVHMGIHCLTHVCTLLIRMHSLHVRTHAHAHTHSKTYSHLPSVSFSEGNKLGFQTMLGVRFSRGVIWGRASVCLSVGILMPCASWLQELHTRAKISPAFE